MVVELCKGLIDCREAVEVEALRVGVHEAVKQLLRYAGFVAGGSDTALLLG